MLNFQDIDSQLFSNIIAFRKSESIKNGIPFTKHLWAKIDLFLISFFDIKI